MSRKDAYHRSFVSMRNALRAIIFHNGDCYRLDEPKGPGPCECPICLAKAALEGEEDWRFMGRSPERRPSMPRELALHAAWRHYFLRSAGEADGTTKPMDMMLGQILGVDGDQVTERDWFVATTIVQWLATNVGQCILFDGGYAYAPKSDPEPEPRPAARPSFNHTRADGPFSPCPACLEVMSAADLRALVRDLLPAAGPK